MQQFKICCIAVVSLLASQVSAEPPAYGSSTDDFDINSISSYLDDDKPTGVGGTKGMSFSYSNSFNSQPAVLPDRFKGASTGPFTFGQKLVPASPSYTSQVYNQAYSNLAQQPTLAEYAAAAASNYNGNPSLMNGYGTSFSSYNSAPMVAHGTNAVPYVTAPSKPISTTHSGNSLPNYSGSGAFHSHMDTSPSVYPTAPAVSNASPYGSPYDGSGGPSPFGTPNVLPANRPPYPFVKPTPLGGHPHFADSYKGNIGPYNSPYEGGSKPPRHLGVYKGYYSGPTHIASPPTGPSSHIGTPMTYKSPYYSEYKGGPGVYYSGRPQSAYSYKSPNSFESYDSTPYKYISESPRYPRYPSKYGGSRPSPYSNTKYSYSSRPLVYATGYKSYSSKPYSSSHHSYSGHF